MSDLTKMANVVVAMGWVLRKMGRKQARTTMVGPKAAPLQGCAPAMPASFAGSRLWAEAAAKGLVLLLQVRCSPPALLPWPAVAARTRYH